MKTSIKLLPLILTLAAPTTHAALTITQGLDSGQIGNAATGQTFTPSVGITPTPGTAPATVDLTGFSLFAGTGATGGAGLATSFLLIYNGSPAASGVIVGSSSNFLDLTTFPANGSELAWTFDNLTLDYTTEYWAVLSSNNTSTDVDEIGISMRYQTVTNPYAGGNIMQNNFGNQVNNDAKFTATFANIPEPSTALLGGLALLGLLARRRRN